MSETYFIEAEDLNVFSTLSPYGEDEDWLSELQQWAREINEVNNNYNMDIHFKYLNGYNSPFP